MNGSRRCWRSSDKIHPDHDRTSAHGLFFHDAEQYRRFLLQTKERLLASDDSRVFVKLTKEPGHLLCIAQLTPNGKYVGDYVKRFKATPENIELFNKGVNILVERLEVYMNTDDPGKVPSKPPAFGPLTHIPTRPVKD